MNGGAHDRPRLARPEADVEVERDRLDHALGRRREAEELVEHGEPEVAERDAARGPGRGHVLEQDPLDPLRGERRAIRSQEGAGDGGDGRGQLVRACRPCTVTKTFASTRRP